MKVLISLNNNNLGMGWEWETWFIVCLEGIFVITFFLYVLQTDSGI